VTYKGQRKLLHDMVFKGQEPDVVTYNTLLDGLCKKDEINKAKGVGA
jgi:PPR repeat